MAGMPLSRLARDLAAEINYHDWSDAPYRADHQLHHDGRRSTSYKPLEPEQTDLLRMNVMWVAAQVLSHHDPNFDVYRLAEACGVDTSTPSGRPRSGGISAGLRHDTLGGRAAPVLALFCHVCDRAIHLRFRGQPLGEDPFGPVGRAKVIDLDRQSSVWGPVPVHELCLGNLVTPYTSSVAPHRYAVRTELASYADALRDQQLEGLHTTG